MNKSYQDLKVWHKAIELTKVVYALTAHFPADERFGLTNQMRRCSVSIASNIAEGCARNSQGEFLQFLGVALGSTAELSTQLIIAKELSFVTDENFEEIKLRIEEVGKMLSGLKASLSNKKPVLATNN